MVACSGARRARYAGDGSRLMSRPQFADFGRLVGMMQLTLLLAAIPAWGWALPVAAVLLCVWWFASIVQRDAARDRRRAAQLRRHRRR